MREFGFMLCAVEGPAAGGVGGSSLNWPPGFASALVAAPGDGPRQAGADSSASNSTTLRRSHPLGGLLVAAAAELGAAAGAQRRLPAVQQV
jgi:hypothetical protein